jgi:hypothetical protein
MLPSRAQLRTIAAGSVVLGVACLISYWLTSRVLSLAYSVSADDDALGGMWAVIATVFVFRDTTAKSLAAALSRLAATLVSFTLCLAYLTVRVGSRYRPLRRCGLSTAWECRRTRRASARPCHGSPSRTSRQESAGTRGSAPRGWCYRRYRSAGRR